MKWLLTPKLRGIYLQMGPRVGRTEMALMALMALALALERDEIRAQGHSLLFFLGWKAASHQFDFFSLRIAIPFMNTS